MPENPNLVILLSAAIGLIVNTLAVVGVAWKGGHLLGQMQESLRQFSDDMGTLHADIITLRGQSVENAQLIARTVATLDALEERVHRLEDFKDDHEKRGRR